MRSGETVQFTFSAFSGAWGQSGFSDPAARSPLAREPDRAAAMDWLGPGWRLPEPPGLFLFLFRYKKPVRRRPLQL